MSICVSCKPNQQKYELVYTASIDENQDIYSNSIKFPERIDRLTFTSDVLEEHLVVSEDGKFILFYEPGPTVEQVKSESLVPPATYAHTYLLNVESREITEIGDNFGLYPVLPHASIKANNQFVLSEIATRKLYLLDPAIVTIRELEIPPSGKSQLGEIAFSPKGNFILYETFNKFTDPASGVFLYDLETKNEIQLLEGKLANCLEPLWLSTGKNFSITCDLSTDGLLPEYHVYVYDLSQEDLDSVSLIEDFPLCNAPSWSRDGEKMIMLCRKNGTKKFVLFDVEEGDLNEIDLEMDSLYFWFDWSPDSREIIYLAGDEEDSTNIFIMSIDGSNNHAIASQKSNYDNLFVIADLK